MKKRLPGLLTLICCGLMLVSCKDSDGETVNIEDAEIEDSYVEMPAVPTADALAVKVEGLTYVFDGNYTAEGKALVNRVQHRTDNQIDDNLQNVIIHNDKVVNGPLWNDDTAMMLMVLAKGGSVVLADPTIDGMSKLVARLRTILSEYTMGGMNPVVRYVIDNMETSAIQHILYWSSEMDFNVLKNEDGQEIAMSLAVFRNDDCYLVCDDEEDMATYESPVVVYDQEGNDSINTTITYQEKLELNDYYYGLRADNLAEWLNDDEPDEEETAAASRMVAAEAMARRAGGTAEQYLDKIAKSKDFTFDVGQTISTPSGPRRHDCVLKYRIWTAYSSEKQCDVYCVTQEVTAYNQQLQCGPGDKHDWYGCKNWEPWKQLDNQTSGLRPNVYGPYMRQLYMKCELKDGSNTVTLSEYEPKNSTTGGHNVSKSLNFNLGLNTSVNANGPQVGLSGGVSWGTSVSSFDADLAMTASPSPKGVVEWTYNGADVASHFTWRFWKSVTCSHESARNILTSTCTVQQAWVWTLKTSSSSVTIQPTFKLLDHWLTYDRALYHPGEAVEHYIGMGDLKKLTPMVIECPPRHIQTWSMNVQSDDVSAEKIKEIEHFLSEHLSQYYLPSFTLYTKKADHKKSYNQDKKPEDYDELGRYVFKCKSAFDNDNVIEILREAGKRSGMPGNGKYTIVWRQTDNINSDREEYTFSMSPSL